MNISKAHTFKQTLKPYLPSFFFYDPNFGFFAIIYLQLRNCVFVFLFWKRHEHPKSVMKNEHLLFVVFCLCDAIC